MTYDWYKIFNKTEFEALGLVSKTYELNLEDIGDSEILFTKGNYISIIYKEVTLVLDLNDKNPFEFDSHAIYIDENDDVFLGVLVS